MTAVQAKCRLDGTIFTKRPLKWLTLYNANIILSLLRFFFFFFSCRWLHVLQTHISSIVHIRKNSFGQLPWQTIRHELLGKDLFPFSFSFFFFSLSFYLLYYLLWAKRNYLTSLAWNSHFVIILFSTHYYN